MALKDSFINLNKALRTTLQNVPAVVDTLIRGFDDVADAVEEQNTYSTDEKVIGTWIDGSKLYSRYVDFGAIPNSSMKEQRIEGIDIKELTGIGFAADYVMPIPYIYPSPDTPQVIGLYAARPSAAQTNKDTIRMITNSDRTGFTAYIKIKYTKVPASRSPEENDTKNVIEDEITLDPAPVEELKK